MRGLLDAIRSNVSRRIACRVAWRCVSNPGALGPSAGVRAARGVTVGALTGEGLLMGSFKKGGKVPKTGQMEPMSLARGTKNRLSSRQAAAPAREEGLMAITYEVNYTRQGHQPGL